MEITQKARKEGAWRSATDLRTGVETSSALAGQPVPGQGWLVAAILALAFLWCSWPTLTAMAQRWSSDAQYSHGFLVPVFALVVLWARRGAAPCAWQPAWIGVPVLLFRVCLRLVAVRMDIDPLDAFSLLPTLVGLVLLVGGWGLFRFAWPALAFLAFMLPLPFQVEVALAHPLRRLATTISTYVLQSLGYPAIAEGNIILLENARLGVAEACNGLGMLITFFALATAMAIVSRAPLLDRIVLVISAAPIAVLANVARIVVTGVTAEAVDDETAHMIMHDLAGWLMMPFALLLLWLELRYLARLLPAQSGSSDRPLPVVEAGHRASDPEKQ